MSRPTDAAKSAALTKEIVRLHEGEKLYWKEIGARVGVSAESARVRYRMAQVATLREENERLRRCVVDQALRVAQLREAWQSQEAAATESAVISAWSDIEVAVKALIGET